MRSCFSSDSGRMLIRFFPVLRDIKVIRTYAGLRPYTPDHFPIISDMPVPGFYVAAGHEGNGIGLSLITGQLITQMICEEPPETDIKQLSLSRFANTNGDTDQVDVANFNDA